MSRLATVAAVFVVVVGAARVAHADCGNISFVGCCIDDTHSQYCATRDAGLVLVQKTCSGTKPSCGWDATNKYYTCTTSTASDPGNVYPRLCSALPDGGPIPPPEKGVKGDKGPTGDKTIVPCGNIKSQGCCEGDTAKWCSSGSLATKNCATSSSGTKCGWDSTKKYYTCTSSNTADPSGAYPLSCSATPNPDGSGTKDTGSTTNYDNGAANPDKPKNPTSTKSGGGGCSIGAASIGGTGLLALLGAAVLGLAARRRRR